MGETDYHPFDVMVTIKANALGALKGAHMVMNLLGAVGTIEWFFHPMLSSQ